MSVSEKEQPVNGITRSWIYINICILWFVPLWYFQNPAIKKMVINYQRRPCGISGFIVNFTSVCWGHLPYLRPLANCTALFLWWILKQFQLCNYISWTIFSAFYSSDKKSKKKIAFNEFKIAYAKKKYSASLWWQTFFY